jgi:SpoVK/Ycf46/Vps4 family AAA+-type ATPase
MARADVLKKLLQSYQRRDDRAFRDAAAEIIEDERKKHHALLANELEQILKNGSATTKLNGNGNGFTLFDSPPLDTDKGIALLEVKHSDRYLDDLVLTETIRKPIERLMDEYRAWEILEANGLQPMRRVLFCGPSGCGKTATAEAIAAELGLPLLYVRFDAVVSSLLGETAANLRKVFDYAQRGQWVMFFDEFDAIGRSRDDPTEHGEIKRVVNSFLQILDNFKGRSLVVAATNFEQAIDPAIWRRFDDIVRFEKPDRDQIKILIRKRLQPLQVKDIQIDELANHLSGATYADAERVCLDLRKSSAMKGTRKVEPQGINDALSRYAYRRAILERSLSHAIPTVDQE